MRSYIVPEGTGMVDPFSTRMVNPKTTDSLPGEEGGTANFSTDLPLDFLGATTFLL
jgi:hypothetical protein